jgi:ABC-type polysaccharide/polyol phosphate export permease
MPHAEPPLKWHENAAKPSGRRSAWVALWRSRDLVGYFALRDLRVRYKQAVLGVPYPLFALLGMVVWTYFSSATTRGSEVFASSPELVTKVSFPRLAAPAGAMLPPLVDLAVSIALVAIFMVYYRLAPTWRLAATPVWLLLLVLTAFAMSLWLSALNVRYRDVRQAVGPVLQIWLFASPVAYPSTLLSPVAELAYALNPMAGVIGLARWSVLGTPWPGWPLAVSLTVLALVLALGLAYFRRAERSFADVI